jgi:hypothetical protein
MLRSLKRFRCGTLIDRVIQKESLCVYNMNNKVKNHFRISIETVQSQAGTLVNNMIDFYGYVQALLMDTTTQESLLVLKRILKPTPTSLRAFQSTEFL